MGEQELKDILEQHKIWLNDSSKGKRADFRYADLSSANFRYADLRYANFRYANLRYANFRYADLRYADLSYADLRYADLLYADFRYANLSYANFRYADLSSAYLDSANLNEKYKGLFVGGTKYSIVILIDFVQWGCRKMTFDELRKFNFSDCKEVWDEKEFNYNKQMILNLIDLYRS